eukprot:TRINITY_DN773144_c0_g1_i1.p1 TRINITY_DN773144_c0_g1~~TRINITY_DN773144_c0_g1_i1.p1  ORF type:complete len:150 (+),score=30.76 TRINITY_DN773144_c0_g1_i1:59-508(+)
MSLYRKRNDRSKRNGNVNELDRMDSKRNRLANELKEFEEQLYKDETDFFLKFPVLNITDGFSNLDKFPLQKNHQRAISIDDRMISLSSFSSPLCDVLNAQNNMDIFENVDIEDYADDCSVAGPTPIARETDSVSQEDKKRKETTQEKKK